MSVINQLSSTRQTRGDSAPGKTAGPHASFQAVKRDPKKDGKPILAARVSEVRALQAEQATSRRRLDELFQSLLHRAFQGEL